MLEITAEIMVRYLKVWRVIKMLASYKSLWHILTLLSNWSVSKWHGKDAVGEFA